MPAKDSQEKFNARERKRRAKSKAHIEKHKAIDERARKRAARLKRDSRPKNPSTGKLVTDLGLVKALAELGSTHWEIATALRISVSTFNNRMRDEPGFAEAFEAGKQNMMNTLRRLQWKNAKKGNTVMQIWLGKQELAQKDKAAVEQTGKDGGPVEYVLKFESNI